MTTFHPTLLHEFAGWANDVPVPLDKPSPAPSRLKGWLNRTFVADMSYVERVEGKQDWAAFDAWLVGNVARRRTPVIVLCELPKWLNRQKDPWDRFENYCFALRDRIERYSGVQYWIEAGREFDTKGHLGYDEPRDIVELWERVRRVFWDRSIFGSIVSLSRQGEGLQRLARALDLSWTPLNVSVHLYDNGVWSVDDFERLLHEVRGLLIGAGAPLAKLWVTEFGLWRPDGQQFADLTEKQQGAWLRAAMRAQIRAGVEHALFWHFDKTDRANGGFGFTNASKGATVWNAAVAAVS